MANTREIHIIGAGAPERVSPTCLCGTRQGSPHDEYCPFPCFAGGEGTINAWENQRAYIVEQNQLLERMMDNRCTLCGIFVIDKRLPDDQMQRNARRKAWERREAARERYVPRYTREI